MWSMRCGLQSPWGAIHWEWVVAFQFDDFWQSKFN